MNSKITTKKEFQIQFKNLYFACKFEQSEHKKKMNAFKKRARTLESKLMSLWPDSENIPRSIQEQLVWLKSIK